MQIKVSLHVFGSITGYTTIAKTDDITVEQCAKLESFSFGQTNDSNYLDSLDKKPAIISRPLDSGRWAITRVLKGNPDDYNRQTMLFVTAVISADDWLNVLHCDVIPLLDFLQHWQFSPSEKLTAVDINILWERPVPSPEIRQKVMPLLYTIENLTLNDRITILLDEQQYDIQVLHWLNMILPRNSKTKFSYAVCSLNDGIDVDVISLSPIASTGNSIRKVIRNKEFPTIQNSIFASMVDKSWHKEGVPPWEFIEKCQSFSNFQGLPAAGEPPAKSYRLKSISEKSPVKRQATTFAIRIFFVLIVMAILGITGYFAITQIKAKKGIRVLITNASTFLETHSDQDFSTAIDQLDKLIADCRSLIFQIDDVTAAKADIQLIEKRNELKKWLDNAANFQLKYNALKQLIDECNNANLSKFPDIYPDPNQVDRRLFIEKRCRNSMEDAFSLKDDFVQQLTEIKNLLVSWQDHLLKLITKKNQDYDNVIVSLPKNNPNCYDYGTLSVYKKIQMDLTQIKEDPNLKNAVKSPIADHSDGAKKLLGNINDINDKIVLNIKKMEAWRDESTKLCRDANLLIEKPSSQIKDINDVNEIYQKIDDLNKISQKINEAKKKWPANPEADVLFKKLDKLNLSLQESLNKNESIKLCQDANLLIEKPSSQIKDINDVNEIYQKIDDLNKINQKINEAKKKWPANPEADVLFKKLDKLNLSLQESLNKNESIKLCQDANLLIEKLSSKIKDINDVNEIYQKIDDLNKINQKINEAKKKWSANPEADVLFQRLNKLFFSLRKNVFKITDKKYLKEISDYLKGITFDGNTILEKRRIILIEDLDKQAK